jgi:hypothetical protein
MTTTARPSVPYLEDVNTQEIRSIQLGRYLYALLLEYEKYYVRCSDVERNGAGLAHGPLSEEEAHAFIDARVERAEELRRE